MTAPTPGLEVSKTLFFLTQGITRDPLVTPGLPLVSETGHVFVGLVGWIRTTKCKHDATIIDQRRIS